MRRHRLLVLLAVAPLLTACGDGTRTAAGPAAAPTTAPAPTGPPRDPTVLLATGDDGALVRVDVRGGRAKLRTLVPDGKTMGISPLQVVHDGADVVVAEATEGGSEAIYVDAALVDVETGQRRPLTRGGESVELLFSPDGRHRYLLEGSDGGIAFALHRTDAAGRGRTTLVPRVTDTALYDATPTTDGRTLYVISSTWEKPARLLAVDTATGATRVVPHGTEYEEIHRVAVSPDGRTLALTLGRTESRGVSRVALLPAGGGAARFLESDRMLAASAFSRDGRRLVLGIGTATDLGDDRYREKWMLGFADVATGRIDPIPGTDGLRDALPVD